MREFIMPSQPEPPSQRARRGLTWSDVECKRLKYLLSSDVTLDNICNILERSRLSIMSKTQALGLLSLHTYIQGPDRYFHTVPNEFLEKCPTGPYQPITQPTEEITMTTPTPVIEVKTFIAGTDAANMTDMQIFQRIAKMEDDAARLEEIRVKPKKLIAHICTMREDILKLAEYVDNRPETVTEAYIAEDGRSFQRPIAPSSRP